MKTHEEMTRNVFERIHAYEKEKRAKRAKITMAAVPVCAVAVIGFGLWSLDVFRSDDGLLVNRSSDAGAASSVTEMSAENAQTVLQTTVQTKETGEQSKYPPEPENYAVSTVGETHTVSTTTSTTPFQITTSATTTSQAYEPCLITSGIDMAIVDTDGSAVQSTTTTALQAQNSSSLTTAATMTLPLKYSISKSTTTTTGLAHDPRISTITTITAMPQQIHLPNIVFPPDYDESTVTWKPDYTVVYDFGEHIVRSTPSPKPYDIWISEPLIEAMEYYGANAPYHYLVTVEYFDSDGNTVHFSTEELEAEAKRLAELVGYVGTAVVTVDDNPPHLVLNATMEKIQAFPGKAGYGCFLHLRDEAEYLIEKNHSPFSIMT